MTIVLIITLVALLLYLLYPVYLWAYPPFQPKQVEQSATHLPVSLILLTYNGVSCLEQKINLLRQQLHAFTDAEFIVIDDCSTDGTQDLLESLRVTHGLKLFFKKEQRGIPHSMNMGVMLASHNHLIFCDQRQTFTSNILDHIVAPLLDESVGAVSAYISCRDHRNNHSFIRRHENFIKKCESRTGYMIGVYGPLYAIRKSCYHEIDHNIILDDLYLSLKILAKKRIVIKECCCIVDDDFARLYNFKRSRRYLQGLMQILFNKKLMSNLSFRIKIMLVWHKYVRLLIPPMIVICYLTSAALSFWNMVAAVVFISISLLILISTAARRMNIFSNVFVFFSINFFYVMSFFSIVMNKIFFRNNAPLRTKKV